MQILTDSQWALLNRGQSGLKWPDLDPRLWTYQLEGIKWLRAQRNCLLADEMGLGKTCQVLHSLPTAAPVIIFCPLGVVSVWAREIEQWTPFRRYEIVTKMGKMRFPGPGETVITNIDKLWPLKNEPNAKYETLDKAVKNLLPNTLLVVDEATLLKGKASRTQRVKRWRKLAQAVETIGGSILGITGTPVLNYKHELYNLLVSLRCHEPVFPGGYLEAERLLDWDNKFSPPHPCIKERLKKVMLKRTRAEVFPQMPPKIREYQSVVIPKQLNAEMDKLWSKLAPYRLDTLEDFFAALMAEGGIEVFSKIKTAVAAAKIPYLLEIVEEMEDLDEPLVVCSAHLAPVQAIGTRPGWAIIDGSVSGDKRGQIEDDFREGRLKGVALTIKAGGVGISLTRAHRMIINDLEWSPGLMDQCEDRLRPHLQEQSCVYTYLRDKHPMTSHMLHLLNAKRKLIGELL